MNKEQQYDEVVVIINMRIPVTDNTKDSWYACHTMNDQVAQAVADRLSSDDLPEELKGTIVINQDWEMCRQINATGVSRNLYTYVLPPIMDLYTGWNNVERHIYEGQEKKWADGYRFIAQKINSEHPEYNGIEYESFPKIDREFTSQIARRMVTIFVRNAKKRAEQLFYREVVKAMEGSFEDGLDEMTVLVEEPF